MKYKKTIRKLPIVSIDVGGTLTKLIMYIPDECPDAPHESIAKEVGVLEKDLELRVKGGTIHIIKCLSNEHNIATALRVREGLLVRGQTVYATGGGAHKYEQTIKQLGLHLHHHDEMQSLVKGLKAIIKQDDACFLLLNNRFGGDTGVARERLITAPSKLDVGKGFIIVNIGSGVSFLYVKGNQYRRIGGSSLGGSTFLGLCALLTGVDDFDEALGLAANGDSTRVDMLVRDIYGDGKSNLFGTLRPTALAASFGKMLDDSKRRVVSASDLALSTLMMCTMNVAAIAHLHAKQHNVNKIVFTGNFLATGGVRSKLGESVHLHSYQTLSLHKRNTVSMRVLSYAVSFWSNDKNDAVFLKHEGCIGAIGALLTGGVDLSQSSRM